MCVYESKKSNCFMLKIKKNILYEGEEVKKNIG